MTRLIAGKVFKDIYCKNDNCRKLLGYEKISEGDFMFICPRCGFESHYNIKKGSGQVIIEQVESLDLKGGE